MARSGMARTADLVMLLVATLPLLAVIAVLGALPPVPVLGTDLAWLHGGLLVVLVVLATVVAGARLVRGLRHGTLGSLLEAGAAAALAGGGLSVAAAGADLTPGIAAAAGLLAATPVARRAAGVLERDAAMVVAITILALAEAAALAGLLPIGAEPRTWLAAAAIALAVVAASLSPGRDRAFAAMVGVGAASLLVDRGGSLELVAGLAALGAGLLAALRPIDEEDGNAAELLPELASRLSDAVLRFDGRLQLRDWNAAAASLLGLDASSSGMRLEDLLGVPLGDLPAADGTAVTRRAVGGLEIAMHRLGLGVTAVIRDPGAMPEADRLGTELRSTIEELLRARRTIDLQRGELERSSTVDPLTGVSSRAAILERLRLEVAQARRYHHPLAVVLLDVDRFGQLNRVHGIGGGDTVLREVALRIRLRVREADALGRSGSDGFLAVLPHTDEAGAATFADALRHRLGLRSVAVGEALVPVTVSIGVATMRAGEDLDVDGLLARVQEALDSARSTGGDRIALDRLHGLVRLEDPHDHPPATADDEARSAE